ncbi:metallophosphoesterase family protein [Halorussus halophilus]|uniref:metallophosphoesterase family protein n=1 Tax=Halorussus halophilus TaxID=2650975 RepID=UPI001300F192|nr:metallophosphoesterase family protein [Halorussus halophilus]
MTDLEIAVVSDTHVPSRADEIPDWVAERIRDADHTIHAGDFDSEDAYQTVEDLADGNLTAVAGNTDPPSLGLPAVTTLDITETPFVVTHGTGPKEGYRQRVADIVRREADDHAVGVSGHTHEVLNEDFDGVHLLNPGSATGARPAGQATMMTVRSEGGQLRVEVHEEGESGEEK